MTRAPLKSLVGPVMVLAVVLLVANVAVFAVWTAPRWSARLGVAGGAGGVENARRRIEPALRLARDTYGRLSRADDDLEAFRSRLITTVGGAELLGLLDGAGDGVGIELDDSTLQYVPLDELGVVQLGINFPVTGTYEAVRRLLDELVALPVFLVIDGVGLQTFGGSADAAPPGASAAQTVRVDLAISVFLDDPELAAWAPTPPVPAPRRPLVSERETERLRRASRGNDPEEIADALLANLAALPELPVDPASLVIDLDKLDTAVVIAAPRRNLFSIVLPPAPAPVIAEGPEVFVAPEPILPVRLLGVLRIEGRWHASVTDEDRVFIVEAGDSLPNGVEIIEVGADYAEVTFGNERTRLTLEGTRP
jgi:hypothetical protein